MAGLREAQEGRGKRLFAGAGLRAGKVAPQRLQASQEVPVKFSEVNRVVKYLILAVLIVIIASLASALLSMVRNKGSKERMVRALTVRIALSIGLIGFIILAASLGWITPHELVPTSKTG